MEKLRVVLNMALADIKRGDLREFIQDIKGYEEQYQQYDAFCEEYGVGEWFYDALVNNEVDLIEELTTILNEKG